jgi:hypothetical protein
VLLLGCNQLATGHARQSSANPQVLPSLLLALLLLLLFLVRVHHPQCRCAPSAVT